MTRKNQKKPKPPETQNAPSADAPTDVVHDDSGDDAAGSHMVIATGTDVGKIDESNPLAAPIHDLARAFAVQAEMLKVLHDNQAEIIRSMKKDGRSEMMLNSTKALNETFRGVKEVQEGLIDKLNRSDGQGGFSPFLVGGLFVVFFLFFAGGLYWAVSTGVLVVGDSSATTEKLARFERENKERTTGELETLAHEKEDLSSSLQSREQAIRKLETSLAESNRRSGLLDAERTERARLESELNDLKREAASADLRHRAIEDENRRLSTEALERLKESLTQPARGASAEKVQPIEQPAAVAASNDTDSSVTPDAPADSKVLATLNRLLLKNRSDHSYRFEKVGSVNDDHLSNVVLLESSPGGGVIKRIEADEVKIKLTDQGGILELLFSSGSVRHRATGGGLGSPAPFYKGSYRVMIYTLNAEAWRRDALSFVN